MQLYIFQNNFIFYNSYFKRIEQGVSRIERLIFCRYYMVIVEKFEIVFNFLASNCILDCLCNLPILDCLWARDHIRIGFIFEPIWSSYYL